MVRFIVVSIALITLVAFSYYTYRVDPIDGAATMNNALWFNNDTVYSPGYSRERWKKLILGTSKQNVLDVIGKPLGVYSKGNNPNLELWVYSESPGNTHYRIRNVEITDGMVTNIYAEFYLD